MKNFVLNAYFNTTLQIDSFIVSHDIKRALRESQVLNGLLTIYLPKSAASIILVENDKLIQESLKQLISSFVSDEEGERPQRRSGTGRESSHLRALLLPQTLSIPIKDGKLFLGPWQEVVVYDFDDKIGRREVMIQVMGDGAEEKAPAPRK
ncbi:secondary thiamine-phosphate synthase enzyme YjbQ [bacterium]|nr:secondary thiamine-phosphate synthase enzyme YjbQ [bacterium]